LRTGDDPVHDASWVDDHRVVFLAGSAADAGFQVYEGDLDSGRITKLTNAPFLAFQPSAAGGRTLRFLNREGWHWTLDEIPLPAEPPPAASGAPVEPLPAAPAPPLAVATNVIPSVVSDTPASGIDHLFIPQLYGPTLAAAGRAASFVGGVLSGGDRLEIHRWALAGYYQFVVGNRFSGSFAYSNRQLAPLTLSLAAAQFSFADVPRPIANPTAADYTLQRRERQLTFDALRFFYDNPVSLGCALIESFRPDDPAALLPLRRIAGPHLSAAYAGTSTSAYLGANRLFLTAIDAAAYPGDWNSAGFGFFDLRGEVAATLPLPLYRRHLLTLDARGRDLAGAPAGERMLTVGGYVLQPLVRGADRPERVIGDYPFLPPGAVFVEPLRGFEDYPFAVDRIAIGSATYRLPIIVDRGWASTLGLLPALFIRQFDFDLFALAASDGTTAGRHSAAGGSLSLQLAFWVIPITLRYQIARRFTDDQGVVQLVMIGL
jgi:hypothetical protein